MNTTPELLRIAALKAVRSEHAQPLSTFNGYDRQAVMADLMFQVDGCLNDEEALLDAIRWAETELGIDCLGVSDERLI